MLSTSTVTSFPLPAPVPSPGGSADSQLSFDSPVSATATIHTNPSPRPPPTSISKPKQKRNKPTLSCSECVDRKTKCDRGRPKCLACVKRSSDCQYTQIANIIASNHESRPAKAKKSGNKPVTSDGSSVNNDESNRADSVISNAQSENKVESTAQAVKRGLSLSLLNKDVQSQISIQLGSSSAPIDIFSIDREHPFANYWTCQGGLAEVVNVAPSKEQADILVERYFATVDPLYPVIDRVDFLASYNEFWSMSPEKRASFDASTLALHFVVYAIGTQFVDLGDAHNRTNLAEFYISASHQALRLSSYWNHVTFQTVQAMVMTFHFLVNDNHVSDAWSCAGIIVRQAQVLQLNRDPNKIKPNAPAREKHLRLLLWQCIMVQNVVLGLLLRLSPSLGDSDITPESFDQINHRDGSHVGPEDIMDSPIEILSIESKEMDLRYSKCMFRFCQHVCETIMRPRSLEQPMSTSPERRKQLIAGFKSLYTSMSRPYGSYDPKRFLIKDARVAKQQIGVCNNFFHPIMLICAESNPVGGVSIDGMGTLEAAHESLLAFFAFCDIFGHEVNGYWAYQHRSFEVALTMANLLVEEPEKMMASAESNSTSPASWLLMTAKEDVHRMIEIIKHSSGYFEFQTVSESRLGVLQSVFDKIKIV